MKDKINLKRLMKLTGNIIVIAALAFIVKKFADMDIDPKSFRSTGVIVSLAVGAAVQTLLIVLGCYPWLVFTQSLSGRKIPFSAAMPVYTKSNIYKYLPGNVFQYVGRNKLAADMKISHVDVACATVFDIAFCVISTGIVSVVLLGGAIAELLEKYGRNLVIAAVCIIAAAAVLGIFVFIKFREKLGEYLSRYSKAFSRRNFPKLLSGALYYFFNAILSAAMYFTALKMILGSEAEISELLTLTGAFMFAWIIGFVTPGAPGGIGIREGVMIFVSGDKFADKIVLFVLVMRVSSVVADIFAFVIGRIYSVVKSAEHTEKVL